MDTWLEWALGGYAVLLSLCNWRLSRRIRSVEVSVNELKTTLQSRDEDSESQLLRTQIKINETIASTVKRCMDPYIERQEAQGALLAQVHDVVVSIANKYP